MKLEVEDLKKIHILPGETIVVTCDFNQIYSAVIQSFLRRFKEIFPNNKVLIIPKGIEIYKIISEER